MFYKETLTKNQIWVLCPALQFSGHMLLANHFRILRFGLLLWKMEINFYSDNLIKLLWGFSEIADEKSIFEKHNKSKL